jgi:hypothetical protein
MQCLSALAFFCSLILNVCDFNAEEIFSCNRERTGGRRLGLFYCLILSAHYYNCTATKIHKYVKTYPIKVVISVIVLKYLSRQCSRTFVYVFFINIIKSIKSFYYYLKALWRTGRKQRCTETPGCRGSLYGPAQGKL